MGVNDAVQLDVVALRVVKLHGVPVKLPVALPVLVNATVPAGAEAVPAVAVSFTNAVQLVACPVLTTVGEQVTVVEVVRRDTLTVFPVPELLA